MKKNLLSILAVLLVSAILLASCNAPEGSGLNGSDTNIPEAAVADPCVAGSASNEFREESTDTGSPWMEAYGVDFDDTSFAPEASSANEPSTGFGSTVFNEDLSTAAHTHDYRKVIVDPTCITTGYTKYVCACGSKYIGDETPMVDHVMVYKRLVPPTETERGRRIYSCKNCGIIETEALYSNKELSELIARYALAYINQYRAEEGAPELIVSDKLMEFAAYRAQQAMQGIEHRAHILDDQMLAAEATKFGTFHDMPQEIRDADGNLIGHKAPYWWYPDGMEAWCGGPFDGYADVGYEALAKNTGKCIANSLRNSDAHWVYVGGKARYDDFIYAGIAVSLNGEYMNCYVVVGDYNPDVKGYHHIYLDKDGQFQDEWIKP